MTCVVAVAGVTGSQRSRFPCPTQNRPDQGRAAAWSRNSFRGALPRTPDAQRNETTVAWLNSTRRRTPLESAARRCASLRRRRKPCLTVPLAPVLPWLPVRDRRARAGVWGVAVAPANHRGSPPRQRPGRWGKPCARLRDLALLTPGASGLQSGSLSARASSQVLAAMPV